MLQLQKRESSRMEKRHQNPGHREIMERKVCRENESDAFLRCCEEDRDAREALAVQVREGHEVGGEEQRELHLVVLQRNERCILLFLLREE